jgi:hypothetical protein
MSAHQKKHPFDFKTQYRLRFNPQDDEIVVDFFCRGGSTGTGLEMGLGRTVSVVKNHSTQAISMHTMNHPGAKHFTTDVLEGDPDTECGRKAVGWFHMSPDCTHHSQAARPHLAPFRGAAGRHGIYGLLEGDQGVRLRCTGNDRLSYKQMLDYSAT